MARCGGHFQDDRHIALFCHADQRRWLFEPGHHAVQHQKPLVNHKIKVHFALGQQGGNLGCTAQASHLFVGAIGQVHRALRRKAAGQQHFHCFHLGHQIALVVPGATAPHKAIFHLARKGRHLPVAFGARCDGHHILVGHEHDGLRLRVAALPGVKQAQARHFLALELGVNQRKLGLQQGVQLPKFVGIELGVIAR